MAVNFHGTLVSVEAGQDLSSSQFRFLTVAADEQADPTGAGAAADGVSQDNNADEAGKAVQIMLLGGGVSKVEAGAAVTAGDEVMSDASGRAITATTGNRILGRAWSAAGAAAEILTVNLYMGPVAP